MNRYFRFLKRLLTARKLGISFRGTTYSSFPEKIRVRDDWHELSAPDDSDLVQDIIGIWLDDDYGLSRHPSTTRTVIDIGANVGLFSLFARHHFPNAIIHAYEPDPRLIRYTAANLERCGVSLFNEGVSEKDGRGGLLRSGSSRLNIASPNEAGEVSLVSMRTVVARIGRPVDLLKLDCEGVEWSIFRDAGSFVNVRNVSMEYHLNAEHDLQCLRDTVGRLGFEIEQLHEDNGFGIAWMRKKGSSAPGVTGDV